MRTIPQIRARLKELATEHGLPELFQLAEETKRRAPIRQAPRRRPRLSPERQADIRAYAEKHPDTAYHDIANAFGTSIGRVSEALAGKREEAD